MNHLSRQEIEGAWKRLCAGTMCHAAEALRPGRSLPIRSASGLRYRQEGHLSRRVAEAWVAGDQTAAIPFETACEALGLERDRAREALARYALHPRAG